jgi:exonuclease III
LKENNNYKPICTQCHPISSTYTKGLKSIYRLQQVLVGDFNTPLSQIDRSHKQNINKEILELNDTTHQMALTNVYRIFHPTAAQYTFFLAAHGTFSKIEHILRAHSKPQQI